MTKTLSRREKLLLWLLTSTLIFSASFSYGAVDQSRVSSIMSTITTKASLFSDVIPPSKSQSPRAEYYTQVYTGLRDAIDMLIVVRDQVASLAWVDTKSISPGNPGGNPTDSPPVGISYPPSSGDITTAMRNCPKWSYFVRELLPKAPIQNDNDVWFFPMDKSYPPVSTGSYAVFTMTIPELNASMLVPGQFAPAVWFSFNDGMKLPYQEGYTKVGSIVTTGPYELVISPRVPCDFSEVSKFSGNAKMGYGDDFWGTLNFYVYKKWTKLMFFGKEIKPEEAKNFLPDDTKYYVTIRAQADESGKARVNTMYKPKVWPYASVPTNEDQLTWFTKTQDFANAPWAVFYNNFGWAYGLFPINAWDNLYMLNCYAKNADAKLKKSLGCPQ